jgi:hypothetical protein
MITLLVMVKLHSDGPNNFGSDFWDLREKPCYFFSPFPGFKLQLGGIVDVGPKSAEFMNIPDVY